VIVQAALANGHRTGRHRRANGLGVAGSVEGVGVVGMHARGEGDEAARGGRNRPGAFGGGDRLTDTKQSARAGEARALNDVVPILVECRVREMDVAIDEWRHGA